MSSVGVGEFLRPSLVLLHVNKPYNPGHEPLVTLGLKEDDLS